MKTLKHYIELLRRLYRNTKTTRESADILRVQIASISDQISELEMQISAISGDLQAMGTQRDYMFYSLYKAQDESIPEAKRRFFLNLPEAEGETALKQDCVRILLREFGQLCEAHGIQYWLEHGTLLGAVRHKGFVPWDDDADVGMMRAEISKLKKAIESSDTLAFIDFLAVKDNFVAQIYRIGFKHFKNPCFIDIFIYDYINKQGLTNEQEWDVYQKQRSILCSTADKLWTAEDRESSPFRNAPNEDVRNTVASKEREAEIHTLIEHALNELTLELDRNDEQGSSILWGIDNFTPNKQWVFDYDRIFPLCTLEFEGYEYLAPNNYDAHLEDWYGDIWTMPNDMITHKHLPHLSKDEIDNLYLTIRETR